MSTGIETVLSPQHSGKHNCQDLKAFPGHGSGRFRILRHCSMKASKTDFQELSMVDAADSGMASGECLPIAEAC